ncbi:hypothetical protein SRIMM317S_02232 [Streptomyces rimosus subsp. rimosus]
MRGVWREITGLVLPVDCAGCGRPRTELCEECRRALIRGVRGRGGGGGGGGPQGPRRVRPSPAPPGLPPTYAAAPYADEVRAVLLAHKERGALRLAGPLGLALAGAVRGLWAWGGPLHPYGGSHPYGGRIPDVGRLPYGGRAPYDGRIPRGEQPPYGRSTQPPGATEAKTGRSGSPGGAPYRPQAAHPTTGRWIPPLGDLTSTARTECPPPAGTAPQPPDPDQARTRTPATRARPEAHAPRPTRRPPPPAERRASPLVAALRPAGPKRRPPEPTATRTSPDPCPLLSPTHPPAAPAPPVPHPSPFS